MEKKRDVRFIFVYPKNGTRHLLHVFNQKQFLSTLTMTTDEVKAQFTPDSTVMLNNFSVMAFIFKEYVSIKIPGKPCKTVDQVLQILTQFFAGKSRSMVAKKKVPMLTKSVCLQLISDDGNTIMVLSSGGRFLSLIDESGDIKTELIVQPCVYLYQFDQPNYGPKLAIPCSKRDLVKVWHLIEDSHEQSFEDTVMCDVPVIDLGPVSAIADRISIRSAIALVMFGAELCGSKVEANEIPRFLVYNNDYVLTELPVIHEQSYKVSGGKVTRLIVKMIEADPMGSPKVSDVIKRAKLDLGMDLTKDMVSFLISEQVGFQIKNGRIESYYP
jgi:hypothetical protein